MFKATVLLVVTAVWLIIAISEGSLGIGVFGTSGPDPRTVLLIFRCALATIRFGWILPLLVGLWFLHTTV